MARLGVYPMPGRSGGGYVLDVQADLLSQLKTRCVVPLVPEDRAIARIKELNPVFDVSGVPHVMVTQAIATVPLKELGRAVISLDSHHDQVTRALDILFLGY